MSKEAMKLALKKAFQLGQNYCYQADHDSYRENKKSDETLAKFRQLVDETCEVLAEQPAQTDWEAVAADQALTIALLKAEQPAQQEPVAVVSGYYGGQCVILPIDPARIFNSNTALYTTPQPPAQPLTDEQIDKLPWGPHEGNPMTFAEGLRDFARAIEAAHGITGETK